MDENSRILPIVLSIIMPSLNVMPYIQECMESVLSQTLREIEILCVDAGSTDGTREILENYRKRDERIRILNSNRKSYGYQINLGIREARGEYIGIVETDDYIAASMYQSLYSYALRNNRPDFVKGGYIPFMNVGTKKVFFDNHRDYLKNVFDEVIDLKQDREKGILDLNHIWSGIYKKDLFWNKDIWLNETAGASYQDVSFSLLVGILADTGAYVKGKYYYYRTDNENSSVKSNAKWYCIIDEFQYIEQKLLEKETYPIKIKRSVWKQKIKNYAWNLLRLPERERMQFLAAIEEEIKQYTENKELEGCIDENSIAIWELLQNRKARERYFAEQRELEEKLQCLISWIKEGERFVLVSAGAYAERILCMQKVTGKKFIEAIADNDTKRQGSIWNGYLLQSVSEVAHKYEKYRFIIANRKYMNELQQQMEDLGIEKDKCLSFSRMLSVEELSARFRQIL